MKQSIENIKANIKQKGSFQRNHIEAILAAVKKYHPEYSVSQIRVEVKAVLKEFARTSAKEKAIDNILDSLPGFRNYPK